MTVQRVEPTAPAQGELATFAMDLQESIRTLLRNYERCEQMCLAKQGVTVAQAYTLLTIPGDSPVTMNEISARMELASSTMTRMIDQLLAKHLVERQHDEEDRRVVWVKLTTNGQRVRRALEKAQRQLFHGPLSQMSEQKRAQILTALKSLNSLCESGLQGGSACDGL